MASQQFCVFVFRTISEICKKNEDIVKEVLKICGVPFFLDILNSHHEETVNASSYVIQVSAVEGSSPLRG